MADIKWSTLFPKTGGSGRGGAFTGKVLTPSMSPYAVTAGDRLVIPTPDQPDLTQQLIIDPSGLGIDEAFQVIDASRKFDKRPVTIKGDKVSIQIVGAGNDLILDMIGAGNLWEFIAGDDGNGGKQLLVADSPGYIGVPGGGGGGGTGGSSGIAILTGVGNPATALSYPVTGLGGDQPILYIDSSPIKPDDVPTNILRTYVWPANTPDDGTHSKWQATQLSTLEQIIWKTDEIDNDHKLLFTGLGDPSDVSLGELLRESKPSKTQKGYVSAIYLETGGTGFWTLVRLFDANGREDGEATKWINIGGGGGGGGDGAVVVYSALQPGQEGFVIPTEAGGDRDVVMIRPGEEILKERHSIFIWPKGLKDKEHLSDPISFRMTNEDMFNVKIRQRAPLLAGEAPPTIVPTKIDYDDPKGADSDWLYLDTATGTWYAWPKEKEISLDDTNYWKPVGGSGSGGVPSWTFRSIEAVASNPPPIAAQFGEFLQIHFADSTAGFDQQNVNLPKLDDPLLKDADRKPIRIARTGSNPPLSAALDQSSQIAVGFDGTSIIYGDWDDFEPEKGDTGFVMDSEGEFVELTPTKWDDKWRWYITISGYTPDDTYVEDWGRFAKGIKEDARPGSTVIIRTESTVTLPFPSMSEAEPITIIYHPKAGETIGPTDVCFIVMPSTTDANNKFSGFSGAWLGKLYDRATDGIQLEKAGQWIRFEPCGGGDDTFWLIVGGSDCYPPIPYANLVEKP